MSPQQIRCPWPSGDLRRGMLRHLLAMAARARGRLLHGGGVSPRGPPPPPFFPAFLPSLPTPPFSAHASLPPLPPPGPSGPPDAASSKCKPHDGVARGTSGRACLGRDRHTPRRVGAPRPPPAAACSLLQHTKSQCFMFLLCRAVQCSACSPRLFVHGMHTFHVLLQSVGAGQAGRHALFSRHKCGRAPRTVRVCARLDCDGRGRGRRRRRMQDQARHPSPARQGPAGFAAGRTVEHRRGGPGRARPGQARRATPTAAEEGFESHR